ncbi:unnamed protein product [Urochloa humidicola]
MEPHVPEAFGHGSGGPAAARGELAAPDLAALQLGGGVEDGRVEAALPAGRAGASSTAVRVVAGAPPFQVVDNGYVWPLIGACPEVGNLSDMSGLFK